MHKKNRERLREHKLFYFEKKKLKKVNLIKRGVLVHIGLRVISVPTLSSYKVLFNLLELNTSTRYDGYLHRNDFKTKF